MIRTQALRLYQGDDLDQTVAVTDSGFPADLTGFSAATAQIRADVADLSPDPPAGTITATLNPPDSTVRLTMAGADIAALPVGALLWDLQLVHPTRGTFTVLRGPVYVGRDVTR
jgi:hypothetical protein